MALFYSVKTMDLLPDISDMQDGSVANVGGFWNQFDGGGGIFVFDSTITLDPSNLGYDTLYDGMIVKPSSGSGRWIRQWDRGKLNIKWFGAKPNNGKNCTNALNVALFYAQFDYTSSGSEIDLFTDLFYTNSGKTIFIPTGRYYFNSQVNEITSGVVLEGEGSNGSTNQIGTTLLINYADSGDESAFLRFVSHGSKNTGGGIRSLTITVLNGLFSANIVTLFSRDLNDVSFWTADTVVLDCANFAKRALFARSFDETGLGSNKWNVRDVNLINCYFSGATQEKSTIVLSNVANFYMIGGFIYRGSASGTISGLWISGSNGCDNLVISGSTLETIKIVKASDSYINCRYQTIESSGGSMTNVVKVNTTTL